MRHYATSDATDDPDYLQTSSDEINSEPEPSPEAEASDDEDGDVPQAGQAGAPAKGDPPAEGDPQPNMTKVSLPLTYVGFEDCL